MAKRTTYYIVNIYHMGSDTWDREYYTSKELAMFRITFSHTANYMGHASYGKQKAAEIEEWRAATDDYYYLIYGMTMEEYWKGRENDLFKDDPEFKIRWRKEHGIR